MLLVRDSIASSAESALNIFDYRSASPCCLVYGRGALYIKSCWHTSAATSFNNIVSEQGFVFGDVYFPPNLVG